MRRHWFAIGLFWLVCSGAVAATTPLRVVTTTTDLQSLTQEIGGNRVAVIALVPVNANAEEYQSRIADLASLKFADMVVRVGADYDLWFDRLLSQANRPELQRGGNAYVDASFAVALLDIRAASFSPSGHAHGSGNPHYWLDPGNAAIITGNIAAALIRLDPVHARLYEQRRLAFLDRLALRQLEWERRLAPFAGKRLLAYHNTWAYFARRFRLNFIDYVESKPGVPPSPAHMANLLKRMENAGVAVIVRQPADPVRDADYLARRGGARVVVLAGSVGMLPGASDYLGLFDVNVARLAVALAGKS